MRSWWLLLFGGVLMLAGSAHTARAQAGSGAAAYAITYFEIYPSQFDNAIVPLHAFAAATRKEDGNTEFTMLDQIGRGGHFAIIEAWRDKAALEAHGAAIKTLAKTLQPYFAVPFDTRSFAPLSIAPPTVESAKLATALYVLTHIDVFPAGKDEVAAMIKTLADGSRKDKGVERFDALVSDAHPNHFHLVEAWTDHLARESHAYSDHVMTFRAALVPFEGALYDERLYEVVR